MLSAPSSATNHISNDREARRQQILEQLKADSQAVLERMADRLVDLADDQAFGQIEYDLRDLAHELATSAHQTGLAAKKRATKAPASSAPTAEKTPASSATESAAW